MSPNVLAALGNHLWQSTVFGLLAGALALLLRSAPASIRSRIWLAASIKFLLPFSLLTALGGAAAPATQHEGRLQPAAYFGLDAASQPFTYAVPPAGAGANQAGGARGPGRGSSAALLLTLWLAGTLGVGGMWVVRWRRLAGVLGRTDPARDGMEVETLRRVEARMGTKRPIPILLSETAMEPGIFGLRRPRLVWPRGMTERLGTGQIEAIMAHEVAHAERGDNLAAALHMVVEAAFWFHPMVWWFSRRMLDERERACDETVILLGNEPEAYAEGILKACRFSVESPLACMAGISGSELKQRIRRIVTERPAPRLQRVPKLLLSATAATTVLLPVVFGFLDTPRLGASLMDPSDASSHYAFEVATVKPGDNGSGMRALFMGPGKVSIENMPLKEVIMFAYDAKSSAQVSGFPEWVNSALYSIEAKEDEATAAAFEKMPPEESTHQIRLMMQALLADRFHLKVSRVAKEIPVYALVVAKGGPKLKISTAPPEPLPLAGEDGKPKMGSRIQILGPGKLQATHFTMDAFAAGVLSRLPDVGDRVVIDKTGLRDHYDFTLRWTPDTTTPGQAPAAEEASAVAGDPPPPGFFTALEEQLGLKLESQKGTVETLVVDSIDRPTPN